MEVVSEAGRVLLSLAVVLGLMWGLARFLRRSPRTRDASLMDVLARQQLTRNSTITVVRVMDQALLLGVTDGQVSLLGEVDLDEAEERLEVGRLKTSGALSGIANRAEKSVAGKLTPVAQRLGSKFGLTTAAQKTNVSTFAEDLDEAVSGYSDYADYSEIIDGYDVEDSLDESYDEIDAATDGAAIEESPAPRSARTAKQSPLAGSALSPSTWRQTVEVLRGASARGR